MNAAEHVFDLVRKIPAGRVASYGQVAGLATDVSLTARTVGQIMAGAPENVPWQRVVAQDGRLPIAKRDPRMAALQRRTLEAEGVAFTADGSVDMARFQWSGVAGSLFDEE